MNIRVNRCLTCKKKILTHFSTNLLSGGNVITPSMNEVDYYVWFDLEEQVFKILEQKKYEEKYKEHGLVVLGELLEFEAKEKDEESHVKMTVRMSRLKSCPDIENYYFGNVDSFKHSVNINADTVTFEGNSVLIWDFICKKFLGGTKLKLPNGVNACEFITERVQEGANLASALSEKVNLLGAYLEGTELEGKEEKDETI